MSKKGERWSVRIFLFVLDRYLLITALGVFAVLLDGAHRADTNIRAELSVLLYKASVELGHPFAVYTANPSFGDAEALRLSKTELREWAEKWNVSSSSRFALQAIGLRNKVQYDTQRDLIEKATPIPSRRYPLLNLFRPHEPVRFAERSLTKGWTFRTTIDRGDYALMVAKQLLSSALPLSVVIFLLLHLQSRVYRKSLLDRRRFEALIRVVLTNPSTLKDEDDFIVHLPAYVREVLGFDSVAVYWMSQDRMTLRAVDSDADVDARAVRHSSERNVLTLESHVGEAMALEEDRLVKTKRHGWRRDVHIDEPANFRDATYIIAPIFDTKKHQVVGLITAERLHDTEDGDEDALINLARLVMILIETSRSNIQMERDLRGIMSLARQAALGTVVPVLAHNLNTPLSMACMVARNLRHQLPNVHNEKLNTSLTQIETQMTDCLAIVKKITDYRKIGFSFGPAVNMDISDLNDVLEKICAFFHEYLDLRHIELEPYFQPGFRPYVKMKAEDIQQVITNMLINADQAFAEQSLNELRPAVRKRIDVRVTPGMEPDGVIIRVRDNGPGVAENLRSRIFDDDFTTKQDGTGAGLAYSLKVIRWHGGTLDLERTTEPGASFKIYLPTIERGTD